MPRRGEIRERRLVGVNVTERKKQLCARSAILREQNVLPYDTQTPPTLTAKQTINNRLAGRAAKGAIPVIGITMLCPMRADSWTLVPRYSVASLLATAPQKRKSHSRFPFLFTIV